MLSVVKTVFIVLFTGFVRLLLFVDLNSIVYFLYLCGRKKKDFNFLEINQNGLSLKNTLPPKYKYFVVQQFFKPKPQFGFEKHPTIKTCRFYVMQFFA